MSAAMIERQALSVTQVNLYIKEIMNRDVVLTDILVKGELSNFKAHSSGHMYMSLKDESGVMRAVMFRSSAAKLKFKPQNGMKVVAHGRITVYERDGQYQLYIDDMQQDGIGDLYVAFEQLKVKLNQEGLFDPAHKKPLPRYPKKVGVVTAPTGAAIRDIINVLSRRFSYTDVVLYPVLVQGENSAQSIVEAIRYFNRNRAADVLIVGRGGGSIEDLWSFNEEAVAGPSMTVKSPLFRPWGMRLILPYPILRRICGRQRPQRRRNWWVPSQAELGEKFNNVYSRLYSQANRIMERARLQLKAQTERPAFRNPMLKVNEERMYLDRLSQDFTTAYTGILNQKKQALQVGISRLDGLSPLGTLARGFSVAKDQQGHVVRTVKQVSAGESLEVMVEDGRILATVDRTEKEKEPRKQRI